MLSIFKRRKKEDREYYRILKEIFGLRPNNVELYKLALIHRSASRFLRRGVPINNERLEFLGDAIIESVVSDYLFVAFPHEDEGFLTKMRSRMVNRATLNELCKDIGLAKYIHNKANGGGEQRNMNGDAFEAIMGAIYLDKGYECANRTLIKVIEKHITLDEIRTTETDFKSRLIEWCQKGRHHLRFSTSYGPESSQNAPQFKSVAIIDGFEVGYGLGSSKKEAEQRAAYTVSQVLKDDMGDMILEMVDKSLGDASPVADKPKRRRKRGGVKHRKVTSSAAEERATAQSPESSHETYAKSESTQSTPEEDKRSEIVETTVADGVVSVSIEKAVQPKEAVGERKSKKTGLSMPDKKQSTVGDATGEISIKGAKLDTGTHARRRGRPRKVTVEEIPVKTINKTAQESNADSPAKQGVPAEKKRTAQKPAVAKPKAQDKSKTVAEPEVQTRSKTGAPVDTLARKKVQSESKSDIPELTADDDPGWAPAQAETRR